MNANLNELHAQTMAKPLIDRPRSCFSPRPDDRHQNGDANGSTSTQHSDDEPSSPVLILTASYDDGFPKPKPSTLTTPPAAKVPVSNQTSRSTEPRSYATRPPPNRPCYQSMSVNYSPSAEKNDPPTRRRRRSKRVSLGISAEHLLNYRPVLAPPYVFPSTAELAADEGRTPDELSVAEEHDQLLSSKEAKPALPPFTKRQVMTLVMMCFANFSATVVFSCIAPFFPTEARKKGASETVIGLIFGIFQLIVFIFAPIFGKYLVAIGPKFLFTAGLFTTGTTSFLFGLLNLAEAGTTFIALCFTIRFFEAIGSAAFITASFATIAHEFPGRTAMTIGVLETFSGLGFAAGPPIGGALYTLGGFGTPFWSLGSLLLISALISIVLIPRQTDDPAVGESPKEESARGMLRLLRIPSVVLGICTISVLSMSLSFIDPSLAQHLEDFHLSAFLVGLMFLLMGGVYTITAPFWGWLVDKKVCDDVCDKSTGKAEVHPALRKITCSSILTWNILYSDPVDGHPMWLMVFGSEVCFVSFMFVGPSPIFPFTKSIASVCISLLIMGVGIGALFIPSFQCCFQGAKENGYPDTLDTYGLVSGLFQGAMSLGSFIGPTAGGALVEAIGFESSTSIIAIFHLVLGIVSIAGQLVARRRRNGYEKMNETDAAPLLAESTRPHGGSTANGSVHASDVML